jgi:hypothetical protein
MWLRYRLSTILIVVAFIVLGITSLILDHVQANRHYEPDGLKRGNEDHRGLAEKSPEIVE